MDKKKLLTVAAVPVVLAFGAFGFAQQQGTAQSSSAGQATQQAENSATDPDNVQQGDQTSPDKLGQAEEAGGPDTDNIQQGGGNQFEDGKPDLPGAPAED